MKKILSLCLAALMIFSVLPAAFAAEEVETIANIEETSEYAEAIKFLNTLDVYTGKENGDLAADEPVERWQMANFLYRVATGDVDHSDVKTTTNYTPFKGIDIGDFDGSCAENLGAISWAYQAKVVNGYSATEYGPTDVIIYQDAITMIVRLLGERYTAASYPYGFVTTARELGILDGITGIGLEDEITRGVVAQLLYNAIFAPVYNEATEKYETLAGNVFNVEKDIVLITATNNIRYSTAANTVVVPTGYIGFNTLNEQGNPVGSQYHAAWEDFGLADITAANAAVGTAYAVYHTNNFEIINSARCLSEVYWNLGDDNLAITSSFASSGAYRYLTIDGSKYQVVSTYTSLKANSVWNQDSAANDQIKVFEATGSVYSSVSNYTGKYVIGVGGHIHEFDYETGKLSADPVFYYVAALDKYYSVVEIKDAEGNVTSYDYKFQDLDSILADTYTPYTTGGFKQITNASVNPLVYHNAYAKYTVTDASDNGYADRITVKQYAFGQIDFDSKTKTSSTKVDVFKIFPGVSKNNTISTVADTFDDTTYNDDWARVGSYRWTGMARTAIADGAYVLYYIDNANKEVDILEVISGAKESDEDGTYVVSGYVRNLNVTSNQVVLEDGTVYTYGYNTLANSPLATKDYYAGYSDDYKYNYNRANYNLTNNVAKIQAFLNKYVTMYVVDDKVVLIKETGANADYVIIDKFVSFEDDGIVANAYTTVTDEYTEIKIAAYNGWTVGGFDYYLYFLSNLLGNKNYADALPFDLNTIYRVQYQNNGVYNLTDASPLTAYMTSYTAGSVNATTNVAPTEDNGYVTKPLDSHTLEVNTYGYITGTDGTDAKDDFTKADYVALSDNDFWLILDKDGEDRKVYAYSGKINPTLLEDVVVYKTKANDYVLEAGDKTSLAGISGMFAGSVSYMMYNANVAQYTNDSWLQVGTSYNYQILMTNVLTGSTELVTLDPKTVASNWTGYNKAVSALKESHIYKIVDGVLYKDSLDAPMTYAVGVDTAAKYYTTTPDFVDLKDMRDINKNGGVYKIQMAGKIADWELIKDEIAKQIIYTNYTNWNNWSIADFSHLIDAFDGNVTLFTLGESANTATTYVKGYLTKAESYVEAVTNQDYVYDIYFVITADNKATAWIVKTNTAVTVSAASEAAVKVLSVANGESTGTETNVTATATASLNQFTDELTVTVTLSKAINIVKGKTEAKIATDKNAVAAATVAADAETLQTISYTWNNAEELPSTVYVRIIRDGGNQLYVAIPVK